MADSFSTLIIATVSIAVVHAFAPDHWLPFVMIGKAQKWSKPKLSFVAFVSGLGHVGSSIILGAIGILAGVASIKLQGVEATRGEIGIYLLIGFGIAYALWGLKHARHHHHHSSELSTKKVVTLWTLFAVFVLGPCEPLIPLMFLGTAYGWSGIATVSIMFGLVTLIMMVGQSLLGYAGIQLIKHDFAEKFSHALAGGVIVLTGVFLYFI
ncbi:MAG: hypothetical protein KKF20_00865 [Bacteroidetes bacterium]|nr:hypothetical protein [Bacteroidota bacterium]MBU1423265.1 hypothetical protein [Bacteroidota bacterium]MBU2470943.1 hypothetical protein [Bacteroidota bacterium]MBU2636740.1 hypothetical protein [Bacteroidota bacterium]MDI6779519.1 hypothetical protein [Bacteroidota bacterium]